MDIKKREWLEQHQGEILLSGMFCMGLIVGFHYGRKSGFVAGENNLVKQLYREARKCPGVFVQCKGGRNFYVIAEETVKEFSNERR